MSELVPVTFGLAPYPQAVKGGFRSCSSINEIQIGDDDVFALMAQPHHNRIQTSSYLEVMLPQATAAGVYRFLSAHDELARLDEAKYLGHSNCHSISAAYKHWVGSHDVDPALITGLRLDKSEVVPANPKEIGQMVPGEVYSFTKFALFPRRKMDDGIYPVHSFVPLPVEGLHISQLGWKGNPYIGSTEEGLDYYSADARGFYHVPDKPSDIGSTDWYARIVWEKNGDSDYADALVAEYEKASDMIKGLGVLPTHAALTSV